MSSRHGFDLMKRLPPLPALHTFWITAQCCNFTRAAEQLDMSQSALSACVNKLETLLGTPASDDVVIYDEPEEGFNAGVAMHLFGSGLASGTYVAGQGQCVGADGHVHCRIDDDGQVWIGGLCATIAAGAALSV